MKPPPLVPEPTGPMGAPEPTGPTGAKGVPVPTGVPGPTGPDNAKEAECEKTAGIVVEQDWGLVKNYVERGQCNKAEDQIKLIRQNCEFLKPCGKRGCIKRYTELFDNYPGCVDPRGLVQEGVEEQATKSAPPVPELDAVGKDAEELEQDDKEDQEDEEEKEGSEAEEKLEAVHAAPDLGRAQEGQEREAVGSQSSRTPA